MSMSIRCVIDYASIELNVLNKCDNEDEGVFRSLYVRLCTIIQNNVCIFPSKN